MNELTTTNREVATYQEPPPLTPQQIIAQVRLIQDVMSSVMRDGEHYGTIPGCGPKPTLLQPGAQKLQMTFRLRPDFELVERDLPGGHKEFRAICTMRSASGSALGQGGGFASTMESKWRFRTGPKKVTDRLVPKSYWTLRATKPDEAQALLGGPGFSTQKDDKGVWRIAEGGGEKVENENIADVYNTAMKIAMKRAQVAAVLNVTAASDIFTQDVEDLENAETATASRSGPGRSDSSTGDSSPKNFPAASEEIGQTRQSTISENGSWEGVIEKVEKITGMNAKGPWTVYSIKMQDGREATTFNDGLAADAEYIAGNKIRVLVEPKKSRPGKFTYLGFEEIHEEQEA